MSLRMMKNIRSPALFHANSKTDSFSFGKSRRKRNAFKQQAGRYLLYADYLRQGYSRALWRG